MPNFIIEKLPNEPIIVGRGLPEWRSSKDMPEFIAQLTALLDAAVEPSFYIGDMTAWNIDLVEIVTAANLYARSGHALPNHPNLREFILISSNSAVEIAAKGLNSASFNHTRMTVLPTVDAALDYARRRYQEQVA